MASPLPAEICAFIFAELEPSTLFVLCRTCRLFLHQAQRILFRSVDLERGSMRFTKSWCRAVTLHSHLAERVHTLSLQIPEALQLDPADGTKIHAALMRCVNLKRLKVVFERSSLNAPRTSSYGWLINNCPFRLTQFTNSYFDNGCIEKFWKAQSELRVLSGAPSGSLEFPDDSLPNLIAVKVNEMRRPPAGRPLQRIEAGFAYHQDYSPLAQYSRTLTTLNLVRQWSDRNVTLFNTITLIAELLPGLVNLGITEINRRRPHYVMVESNLDKPLKKFRRLETFVLLLRNTTRVESDRYYDLAEEDHLRDFGCTIMEASATLHRTVVGSHFQADQEITCILTRGPDGSIHCEKGIKFDFDTMSMFWEA
ncbi:hypothetical protein C8R46DRAFT_1353232 [Mycena filopes]|nr:hypothetical protein C8R46DRAFT_1353232 [Mycena filopes]